MAEVSELLVIKNKHIHKEVSSLFNDLSEDDRLQKIFFQNPSLILRTHFPSLGQAQATPDNDSVANRVLFSVLSNAEFLEFLKEYQKKKSAAISAFLSDPNDREALKALDTKTIRLDFADALLKYGDRELVANLFYSDPDGRPGTTVGWWLIVVVVFLVAAAIHAVLALGTSGDFAPTRSGRLPISASELRKISDQLVAAAKDARTSGRLVV